MSPLTEKKTLVEKSFSAVSPLGAGCLTLIVLIGLPGCDNGRERTNSRGAMGSAPHSSLHTHESYGEPDDDIDRSMVRGLYDDERPSQFSHDGHDQTDRATQPQRSRGPVWSIILGTFSEEGHEHSAKNMLQSLPQIDSRLRSARVEHTRRGSMVAYGTYRGPDDPEAQRDLDEIKEIEMRGRPVFPRAFLTRISAGSDDTRSPYALLSVRNKHPNVDPLYTLQVAVWSNFGSDELSMDEIRRKADAYVRQLRTEGFNAFVHHDEQQMTSIVTVGLFDRNAFDAETGLMSAELREMRRRFPVHLVNGEEFEEPIDPRRPSRGTQKQSPPLVVVPTR